MKKFTLLLVLLSAIISLKAQDYQISFAGTGASTTVGNVSVENLTQGTSLSLDGSEVLHLSGTYTEINPMLGSENAFRIYPNPTTDVSMIDFAATASGKTNVEIFDITGKRVASSQNTLTNGIHSYQVSGLNSGIYMVRITSQTYFYTGKLVSNSEPCSTVKVSYIGNSIIPVSAKILKNATTEKFMQYTTGDRLKFIGVTDNYGTVITDIPTQSKTITFHFLDCTDGDGNHYPVVQIGAQFWMAENLKTTKSNDGTDIPNVTDNTAWTNLKTSGYCWYNNDLTNKTSYGALYNWYTANAGQITPVGWHIPSDSEWTELTTYLGGESLAGAKLKEMGTLYWSSDNEGTTNETGFGAMPGGARYIDGTFVNLGSNGDWWSSTQFNVNNAWKRNIYSTVTRGNFSKQWGISVRCIANNFSSLPSLSTTSISGLATTSAISGGNINNDGGATVIARGVCWSTSSSPTTSNSKTTDGTGAGSFTSSITGLTAGKTYYVRAYATNSIGTAYGTSISFTTLTSVQLPTATTTAITSITTTSATSGGSISSDGGAVITARGVCWSTSSSPTTSDSKTIDGTGAGSFTSSIAGLTAGKTYYVRAYATNSTGTAYGSQISFTTLTSVQLPTLTTIAITSLTTSSATSGGNISSDGGAVITARGVCWSTSSSPTTSNSKTTDGTGVGSFTSSITGLTAGKTYYVRAYATNSAGTAYGPLISFTTKTGVVIFTYPDVTSITITSAVSGGGVSSDGGATITAKGVCWSTITNPTITNSKTIDGTGTGSFTSSITSLTPATTYYVRSYATNSEGTTYGSQVIFTTPDVRIGNYYQGGIVAYILQVGDPGYIAGQTHGIISAISDQSTNIAGYPVNNHPFIAGATAEELGSGNENTNAIVARLGVGKYAAKLCYDLVLGGYDDWYLPSKDELNKLYLKRDVIGHFDINNYYYSSTVTTYGPWMQEFLHGVQHNSGADDSVSYVRAVRSF